MYSTVEDLAGEIKEMNQVLTTVLPDILKRFSRISDTFDRLSETTTSSVSTQTENEFEQNDVDGYVESRDIFSHEYINAENDASESVSTVSSDELAPSAELSPIDCGTELLRDPVSSDVNNHRPSTLHEEAAGSCSKTSLSEAEPTSSSSCDSAAGLDPCDPGTLMDAVESLSRNVEDLNAQFTATRLKSRMLDVHDDSAVNTEPEHADVSHAAASVKLEAETLDSAENSAPQSAPVTTDEDQVYVCVNKLLCPQEKIMRDRGEALRHAVGHFREVLSEMSGDFDYTHVCIECVVSFTAKDDVIAEHLAKHPQSVRAIPTKRKELRALANEILQSPAAETVFQALIVVKKSTDKDTPKPVGVASPASFR